MTENIKDIGKTHGVSIATLIAVVIYAVTTSLQGDAALNQKIKEQVKVEVELIRQDVAAKADIFQLHQDGLTRRLIVVENNDLRNTQTLAAVLTEVQLVKQTQTQIKQTLVEIKDDLKNDRR